jgi:hypothetical protein
MAKQDTSGRGGASMQNTSTIDTRVFLKGMLKDAASSYQPKEAWSHARNAANNSTDGDVGLIGNEPANLECAKVPYTIIGAIHTYADQWVLYSTDDINSEIGLFDDSKCEYQTLVNDPCLNFNKKHLIVGAAKENFDCSWQTYWDDGNNPSRTLNINNIPWKQIVTSTPGADCVIYTDTTDLDCEKIRLAPLVDTPCITLSKAESGGQLRNGSYQVFIAYTINEQKVTDYIGISNVQSLFDHMGTAGSLRIKLSNLDKQFDYYELVVLSNNQENTVAKKIGLYSTEQTDIELDYIDQSLVTIPLETIPLRSPAYEKSDSMYVVNDWLIRQGPIEQFDFNYQPLANQIKAKWVVAEYPSSYYYKGGNKTGFMRDEQYAFFIRWIYNTGERSSSYHIPGRPPRINGLNQFGQIIDETAVNGGINSLANDEMNFQIYNTATVTASGLSIPTEDNGIIIAKGDMAYWESTEKYPATRPDIWDTLCGKHIRHHKMPTEEISSALEISSTDGTTIRVLGVEFENIAPPLDNDGNIITNIIGYEILRGSREGHKSILAKGIFRNMREYDIPAGGQTLGNNKGLYPNYPYNDLRPDIYFHDGNANGEHRTEGCDSFSGSRNSFSPLTGYRKDYFTFHSPELMFRRPFLNAYETRIYGDLTGQSVGHFIKSENHPQNKLIRNSGAIIAAIIGIGYAINQVQGTRNFTYNGPKLAATMSDAAPYWFFGGPMGGGSTYPNPEYPIQLGALAVVGTASTILDIIVDTLINDATDIASIVDGGTFAFASSTSQATADYLLGLTPGVIGGSSDEGYVFDNPTSNLPRLFKLIMGMQIGAANIAIGAQEIIDLIYNLVKEEDFAFKYNSHGFYNEFSIRNASSKFRTKNKNSNYIGSTFQEFEGYKINNLFRPMTVAISTQDALDNPAILDTSRFAIGGDASNDYGNTFIKNPQQEQTKTISAIYGSLKYSFENQYGQLDGIKQIQMRGCVELVTPDVPQRRFTSNPIFSGDVYINRYTEKTIMPIFADFLNGQPNQYTYDYLQRVNIPYPRFWMDTRKFDTTQLGQEIASFSAASTNDPLPNDLFYLDRGDSSCGSGLIGGILGNSSDPNPAFAMRYAYMYTHVNGVQDFFVESEYNLAQRDWDDEPKSRHYDNYEYTNVDDLFHADIVKEGNFYKYDLSLSISKLITQVNTFGNVQPRDYDPLIAENCYQYYPKRLIYSLQAQKEAKKDFWRVFLPNNYKDFKNRVNVIKPINKSGAIIFFPYQSPQMFQGIDQLQTDLGTKLTIGDGGLFSQPFQNVVNSDLSNEYGSSENARSVVNTPMGIFYISQAQGKVFHYTGQLENIANAGMKWWFNKYLPSTLIRQYPDLEFSKLSDNPVIGIGCQTIYDANDDIVYFMKKDYVVKEEFANIIFFEDDRFILKQDSGSKGIPLVIGNPDYFNSTSWTVSYDPKAKAWISFHDWFPELCLPSINHFLTTKTEVSTTPACPPGYTFNLANGQCEQIQQATELATIAVDEVLSTITGGPENCLIDIVIAMDVSGSTNTENRIEAQRQFVQDFLNSSVISTGMTAGSIQVGFTRWSGTHLNSMDPLGFSMSNTVTASQVGSYYATAPFGSTNICSGFSGADAVLSNRAGSQLGDRSSNSTFRSIMLFMTDAEYSSCNYSTGGPGGTQVGCQYQTQPKYEVYSIFCHPTSPSLPGGASTILNAITCNVTANQFTVVASGAFPNNTPQFVANSVAGALCGTPPVCDCPPGYTLVYKDVNGNYTEDAGECLDDNPPICRKLECNCPPPSFPGAVTTQTGQCDDFYLTGDPAYTNPNPLLCNYFKLDKTPPSYEKGGLWRHNYRCDLFSNYYGVDYPWEIEIIENTGQDVTTLKSVEYQLESYVYKGDLYNGCADDRWHDLDFNFDESIIYNSEQVSGLLKLELNPKENPYGMLQYPIINAADIRILYSKEEQKYRFNQFWDTTNDRGEFSAIEESIFITQLNGYIKDLNAANLNYNKDPFQHKKFRHYYNKVLLRRNVSGNRKMLVKLANTKLNMSFR